MGINHAIRETAPNLEQLASLSNLIPLRLLSFAKERLGEVM
ncbi:hypothetical protein LBMAG21_12600 [Armatimonadota bacterium]|nr:hypothetical protein LBMAG21_12600 [Armatimonadota bacterium]